MIHAFNTFRKNPSNAEGEIDTLKCSISDS